MGSLQHALYLQLQDMSFPQRWCGPASAAVSTLSPCLVSTLELPAPLLFVALSLRLLRRLLRQPYVNPARSASFKLKVALILANLGLQV